MNEFNIEKFLAENGEFDFDLPEHYAMYLYLKKYYSEEQSCLNNITQRKNGWEKYDRIISRLITNIEAYKHINTNDVNYSQGISPIEKHDIRQNARMYTKKNYDPLSIWCRSSSGTTGRPIKIYFSSEYFFEAQYRNLYKVLEHYGQINPTIYEKEVFCIMVMDNPYLTDKIWLDPSKCRGATIRLIVENLNKNKIFKLYQFIAKYNPAIISLSPTSLKLIDQITEEYNIKLEEHVSYIVSGGNYLNDETRKKFELKHNINIINVYGLSEIGVLASACRKNNGLHIWDNEAIVEILDVKTGCISYDGKGEILASGLNNKIMPLLRYKTGDYAHISSDKCECGLSSYRITKIENRLVSPYLVGEEILDPRRIATYLFNLFDIEELQTIQKGEKLIEVIISPGKTFKSTLNEISNECLKISSNCNFIVKLKQIKVDDKFVRHRSEL